MSCTNAHGSSLAAEIVQPKSQHTHTIINVHGRGSCASVYREEFMESQDSQDRFFVDIFPGAKWVFPTAPILPSTKWGEMSTWFDMYTTDNPLERSNEQEDDLRKSAELLKRIITEEAAVVGYENVILCGISQGAAAALAALVDLDHRICAFLAFSSWIPGYVSANIRAREQMLRTPVFVAHCKDDNTIKLKYGVAMRDALEARGMVVTWRCYEDGGHWFNEPRGIDDVVAFLRPLTERQEE